jgi:hypothetical protein
MTESGRPSSGRRRPGDFKRVRDLVLKGFDEASYLATLLSLVVGLIEGRIDVVAAN